MPSAAKVRPPRRSPEICARSIGSSPASTGSRLRTDPLLRRGVQRDGDASQRLAHRAAGLGLLGHLEKGVVVQPLDLTADLERDAGQPEPTGRIRAERDVRGHLDALRRTAAVSY